VGAHDDHPRRDAGLGRPGSNFGNLQFGSPLDFSFYFPGYSEGSFSGELVASANSANNYQRMPHILTMSSVRQSIPRMWFPEAITQGKAGVTSPTSPRRSASSFPFGYPSPGHVRVEMLYKYGSASLRHAWWTSNRWVKAYQHESLKFVVNQSVWWEGETPFADVILPACTVSSNAGTSASGTTWARLTCTTCTR
jgi:hypothetical protein